MPTVRQAIQAKIDNANALSTSLSQELSTEDQKFQVPTAWLDLDPANLAQLISDYQQLVAKHS